MKIQNDILNIEQCRTYYKGGVIFKVTSNQPSTGALQQFAQKLKSLPYNQAILENSYMIGRCG